MICKDCRDAADVDRQELHCGSDDCTCQHKPLDWLEQAYEEAGREETE